MATTISVTCPECHKQIKATSDLEGKKVRCKGCSHVFVVKAASGITAAPNSVPVRKDKPAAKPRAAVKDQDEEENANPYGVTEEDLTPRCPECAHEMESEEAIICLNCGYNTTTRSRPTLTRAVEHTTGDYIIWLLPGILCVVLILTLIVGYLLYLLLIDKMVGNDDLLWWMAWKGFKMWGGIMSLFIIFFAGRFAMKRLIFNPIPPEKLKGHNEE